MNKMKQTNENLRTHNDKRVMRDIKIEKITLNIGVGAPGDKLDKAMKLLKIITGAKPVQTTAKKRIPTWKLRLGLAIATKVTIRGKKAEELLIKLLTAKHNKLPEKNFDEKGNLSFGIPEYLDIPGVEYDMEIGIIGLEVAVTLERPGYRIKKRSIQTRKINKKHKITQMEAIEFMKNKFNLQIE